MCAACFGPIETVETGISILPAVRPRGEARHFAFRENKGYALPFANRSFAAC